MKRVSGSVNEEFASVESTGEFYVPQQHGNIELEHVHRYLLATEIVAGKAVLDIACGEGYGSSLLATKAGSVTGVDISGDVIEHAGATYRRDNLAFLVGTCADIPLPDGSVDVVVSFETIEHHDQHEAMLREIRRVLRPDGCLLMSTPDRLRYSIEPGTTNPFHVKELFEDEFKRLIRSEFRNAAFFGQRIAYGSTMLPDGGALVTRCYWRDADSGEIQSGNNRPIYWITLASDASLPTLPAGLFEQPIDDSETVNAWRNASIVADARATALQVQVAELQAIVSRSRGVARHSREQLVPVTQALAATKLELDRARALAEEQQSRVVLLEVELARLSAKEAQFDALRSSRLIRLHGAVHEGPLSVRKTARIAKRSLALVAPRHRHRSRPSSAPSIATGDQVPGFDRVFYLKSYPDVAAAGVDPLEHYLQHGRVEGRLPRDPRIPIEDERLPEFAPPKTGRGYLPLVSVIVPSYNHAEYLSDRLTSIYEQTYSGPVEVYLLDDASTDGSLQILTSYADRYPDRTTLVVNEENSGSAFRQWRRGLALARGEVVWIAESDDLCEPTFLATLVPLMAHPAVMLAFAQTVFFRETRDNVVYTLEEYLHDLPSLRFDVPWIRSAQDLVVAGFYDRNIVPNVSGALLRHPGTQRFVDEDEWQGMHLAGDWMFYLELIRGGLVAFSPETTDYHRVSEGSLTTQVGKTSRLAVEVDQVRAAARGIYGMTGEVTDFLPTNRAGAGVRT